MSQGTRERISFRLQENKGGKRKRELTRSTNWHRIVMKIMIGRPLKEYEQEVSSARGKVRGLVKGGSVSLCVDSFAGKLAGTRGVSVRGRLLGDCSLRREGLEGRIRV